MAGVLVGGVAVEAAGQSSVPSWRARLKGTHMSFSSVGTVTSTPSPFAGATPRSLLAFSSGRFPQVTCAMDGQYRRSADNRSHVKTHILDVAVGRSDVVSYGSGG